MNESENQELLRRLQQLESEVNRLRGGTAGPVPPVPQIPPVPPSGIPPIPPPASRPAASAVPPPLPGEPRPESTATSSAMERFSTLLSLENILSKVGIGLVIIGVIYLLKVSIDRGWFTPGVRIGLGLGLATGLLVGGFRLLSRRGVLGQVFLGGSLAIYYACFYAAEQFYHMVKPAPAFFAMLVVTATGYAISLRKQIPVPMVIAILGGLASPFLLGNHDIGVVPVSVYTMVLLVGAAAVVLRLGWSSVWWTGLLGGVFILHSLVNHLSSSSPGKEIDQLVLSGSFLGWWFIYGGLPLWRLLRMNDQSTGLRTGLLIGAFLIPVLALGGLVSVWDMPKSASGWMVLASAGVYLAASGMLSGHVMHQRAHRLSALLLAVVGLLLLLQGDAGFIVVVALAVVLLEAYRRTRENVVQVFGHLAFAVAGVWFMVRMFEDAYPPCVFRAEALANLAGVLAFLIVWFRHPAASWRGVYWVFGTIFALSWLGREASLASESLAWVTLLWGIYALVLIVASVVRWNPWVRRTGLVLLVVVLAKMILVDLANVPAEWRVVLFLGFGLLLLGISYVLPRIAPDWNKAPQEPKAPSPSPGPGVPPSGPPPLP